MVPVSKSVFSFGNGIAEGTREWKDRLGGKGANLHEMTNLGIPVPPGFTICCDVCDSYLAGGGIAAALRAEVDAALTKLEAHSGRRFGDPENPLLVSVRSGARVSMPGMMETILNLGLNDTTVEALAAQSNNPRFAYDSYRRFLQMYGDVVMGVDIHQFEALLASKRMVAGVKTDAEVPAEALKILVGEYKALVRHTAGRELPMDPREQLWGAIEAVWKSWTLKKAVDYRRVNFIPEAPGTAVNIMAMVFGNLGDDSGTGVAFTRDPSTGERRFYGEFLVNAQGEDVVAGIRNTEDLDALKKHFPKVHGELLVIFERLEKHYKDMCDTEFTIEQGKLWMLQTRVGKRTGAAALKMAVDMTKGSGKGKNAWKISQKEAVMRITAEHLDQVLHPQFANKGVVLTKGLAASPGAAVGKVYFTADDAADAADAKQIRLVVRTGMRRVRLDHADQPMAVTQRIVDHREIARLEDVQRQLPARQQQRPRKRKHRNDLRQVG